MELLGWRIFTFYKNSWMFFPDEVLGFPPKRDIDFTIELVPGAAPVSKTPYRMSTPKMIELNMQLQELLEKEYIRPNVSPWGHQFCL